MSKNITPCTRLQNGVQSFLVDENSEVKTANYTVVITTDSGKTFVSKLDGMVFNLPDIEPGNVFTFINMAADGTAELNLSPFSGDAINYKNSEIVDKGLINTKATAKRGDSITLQSVRGDTAAWHVTQARGVWAKEA